MCTHRNGITVDEVLSYVNNDAGQLLNNDPLLQRFTGMMDYMENKGLAAEEVFVCLEVFVESKGQTIYNAFGNLSEVSACLFVYGCSCFVASSNRICITHTCNAYMCGCHTHTNHLQHRLITFHMQLSVATSTAEQWLWKHCVPFSNTH